MTTADELLCEGSLHGVGFAVARLWCLLSSPFGHIVCGSNWVMVLCGLKLIIGSVSSGAFHLL